MKYKPDKHRRRSIRLKGYEYSQAGAYFVTICTQSRECLFGDVVDGVMRLNDAGTMVREIWQKIPGHFLNIDLDEFVVMPNHIHGIIVIVGAQFIASCVCGEINQNKNRDMIKKGVINHAPTIGDIVRAFKARCTHTVNHIRNTPGYPVWQRNYYEHVIRNEQSLQKIREYITDNPVKWVEDDDNTANIIRKGDSRIAPITQNTPCPPSH